MSVPLMSRRKRIAVITVLFTIFAIISPPENIAELVLIVSLIVSVSYDAWWSGIEAERKKES